MHTAPATRDAFWLCEHALMRFPASLRTVSAVRLAAASAALVLLAGCGSDDQGTTSDPSPKPSASATASKAAADSALAQYVERLRPQAVAQMERFEDVYSDFTVTGEGDDTLVYTYTFRKQMDPAAARTSIEGTRASLEAVATTISDEMTAAGVEGPRIRWAYDNADGKEIIAINVP